MDNIDYSWETDEKDNVQIYENVIDIGKSATDTSGEDEELKSRHHMQIMRRVFHMFTGTSIATLYWVSFSHSQMVHFLGTIACVLYLVEQVRISYPETAAKLLPFTKFVMRAEEQLKESAMMPYAMAVLLTIITFPKPVALVGIYTLAFADPMSAIIGIKYGKHKISEHRSYEGSAAFFVSTFVATFIVLGAFTGSFGFMTILISTLMGIFCTTFDLIPLKIDDNLTIPIFTAISLWTLTVLFGVF